jgi:dihydroorotase
MPADITAFRFESGTFELADCFSTTRTAERRIVPVMAFKGGARVDCDLERCHDERNWLMQISEDRAPVTSARLSATQRAFLRSLAAALEPLDWEMSSPRKQDLEMASRLQAAVEDARRLHDLDLRAALTAVYDCFVEHPFAIQIGLFLLRLDRRFALERLAEVAAQPQLVA